MLLKRLMHLCAREFSKHEPLKIVEKRRSNVLNLDKPAARDLSKRKKRIQWTVGSVCMLVIPGFAFSLGVWQTLRLQWKLSLIENLRRRLDTNAIDFPEDDLGSLLDLEYQRVRLTGQFLHDREFTISPRGRFDSNYKQKDAGSILSDDNMSSHGAHVITPFKLKRSGVVIMVNRGWVPVDRMDRKRRKQSEVEGTTTIEAILRKSEKRPQFVQANMPEQGVWFYKDFYQMGKQHGTAPIYVEIVGDYDQSGGPIGGQTNINVRNEHFSYLCTWYSLSAVTLGMWAMKFIK